MLSGKECLISALYVCTFLTVANASKATLLLPFSTAVFQKYRIFAYYNRLEELQKEYVLP